MSAIKGLVVFAFLLLIAAYVGDWMVLLCRTAANQETRGTVQVSRYYAVAEKNNKTEFMYDQPENRECIRTLFPHDGDSPCWYLEHHKEERIDE